MAVLCALANCLKAQNNTFPPTGNVGVRDTTPASALSNVSALPTDNNGYTVNPLGISWKVTSGSNDQYVLSLENTGPWGNGLLIKNAPAGHRYINVVDASNNVQFYVGDGGVYSGGTLTSAGKYVMGLDLAALPISNAESMISSYHGLMLVGNRLTSFTTPLATISNAANVYVPAQDSSAIGFLVRGATHQVKDVFQVQTSGTNTLFNVTPSGNVGIGTTMPAGPLSINEPTAGVGTISVSASSGTVTGTSTNFLSDFNIGDVITANSETRTITAITSATSMTTDNWANTFNGSYATTNANRFQFTGKGAILAGATALSSDGFFTGNRTFVNSSSKIGVRSLLAMAQTSAPFTGFALGTQSVAAVDAANTQNWTGSTGAIGGVFISRANSGASGTITGMEGVSILIGNNSGSATITNAYPIQASTGVTNSGVITNGIDAALFGLGAANNNTGIYLSTSSTAPIAATGNYGIYDATGYQGYFAGNISVGTTHVPTGYKLAVGGNAIAEAMTVELQAGWPDYVIKPITSSVLFRRKGCNSSPPRNC